MAGSGRGCTPALMALAAGKARAGQPEGGRAGNTASKDPAHATGRLVATICTKHAAEKRHDASQDVDGRHAERVARKCSTSCAVGARAADGSGHGTGRSPEDGFVAAVGIFWSLETVF